MRLLTLQRRRAPARSLARPWTDDRTCAVDELAQRVADDDGMPDRAPGDTGEQGHTTCCTSDPEPTRGTAA